MDSVSNLPVPVQKQCYPEIEFGGFSRVDGTIAFYTRVQALLEGVRVAVDVGCGRGVRQEDTCAYRRKLADLRSPGRTVIGLDVASAGNENPRIDAFYQIEDGKEWPVASGSADLVLADFVLEHLSAPEAFFKEVSRVLQPGGVFCARTPNKRGYVATIARMLPSKRHADVVTKAQQTRKEEDVFPTWYRCNTVSAISNFLCSASIEPVVIPFESEPNYLTFSAPLYRIGTVVHRLLPDLLKSTLLVFGRKHKVSYS